MPDYPVIVGIDPGRRGAVAFMWKDTAAHVWRVRTESLPRDVAETQQLLECFGTVCCAVVERPFYPPSIGVRNVAAIAEAFGALRAVLRLSGIPMHLVRPAEWKAALSVPSDGPGIRMRASEFFPADAGQWSKKSCEDHAEAALIAWYGRKFV